MLPLYSIKHSDGNRYGEIVLRVSSFHYSFIKTFINTLLFFYFFIVEVEHSYTNRRKPNDNKELAQHKHSIITAQ